MKRQTKYAYRFFTVKHIALSGWPQCNVHFYLPSGRPASDECRMLKVLGTRVAFNLQALILPLSPSPSPIIPIGIPWTQILNSFCRELTRRRNLSDRLRLANEHAQTRHITLSVAVSIRQFRIISFRWTVTHWMGKFDRTRVREKNVPNTWASPHFFGPYIVRRRILSLGDTLIYSYQRLPL